VNAVLSPFVQSMHAAAQAARLPGSGIGWLDQARAEALRAFLGRGLPDTRNELWKYTALRTLERRAFAPADPDAATRTLDIDALAPGTRGAARIVFVNGAFRADLSRLDGLPGGVTLAPLSRELAERPEPLRFLLGSRQRDDDAFAWLNLALASDGVILRVAPGVRADPPVHVIHAGADAGGEIAWHARSLIEVGEGARLDLVEHHVGGGAQGHFADLVCEVMLHPRAGLDWTVLQHAAGAMTLLRRSDAQLHDDARLTLHALELGGRLARHEIRATLAGDRARFHGRGAFVLRDRQHGDTELLVEHRGRDTVSDAMWRGVADGRARGVFHGSITVAQGADGADANLSNKNLLLSRSAEIDTRPVLEIHADEVKAAHGATVGQLDENVLFYLRSRGIPEAAARRMLVRAFCAEALAGIEPRLRERCDALLAAVLPGEVLP